MSETEVVTNHDLAPKDEEIQNFTHVGSYVDPPMRVEIQFGAKLRRRLGDITPVFNVPEGFKLREYFQYLNPDCDIRTSWMTDDMGTTNGCILDVSKSTIPVYRVVAMFEVRGRLE